MKNRTTVLVVAFHLLNLGQISTSASDDEKCLEYCTLLSEAQGRCPSHLTGPLKTVEACKQDCIDASFPKDGTEQDFLLTDTLQCRQNHALMAIKEGELTNSAHCIHASIEAPARCTSDKDSKKLAFQNGLGEYFFYNSNALLNPVGDIVGKFVLAIRYLLTKRGNLYVRYPYLDVQDDELTCDHSATKYRTADGTCNSLDMPLMGSVSTPFVHNLESSRPHLHGYPDAKKVAEILRRPHSTSTYDSYTKTSVRSGSMKSSTPSGTSDSSSSEAATIDPSRLAPFSQLAVAWIQMMTHDWFAHATRSQGEDEMGQPLKNMVTHWWDASQIYGSTQEEVDSLRVEGGKILLDKNDEIEYKKNIPLTGFNQNFWAGLHVMHTIVAREHNYIVDELGARYKDMTDDEKYGAARLCIAAVLAKIHTIEWTPTLLDNPASTFGLQINWFGLRGAVERNFSPESLADYTDILDSLRVPHFGSSEFGTNMTLFNTSFFMTEEFVAVYRMHPLLPDEMLVGGERMTLNQMAFTDATKLVKKDTTLTFLKALGETPARTLSLDNYPNELYDLDIPGRGKISLAEVDIIRDRERGLPRYNDARRQLLLEPYASIDDLTDKQHERELLKSVYTDIEQVDFMVGCLVDQERPHGFAFGVVPYFIFLVMASRRIFSDRFFQESFTPEHYTEWGIDYVNSADLRSIIVRHFPELNETMPLNPFSNWEPSD